MIQVKKALFTSMVLASLGLTGCGGDSDSSSYEGKKIFANGSTWVCDTKEAYEKCTSDATCKKVSDCTQTVKPKEQTTSSGGSCNAVDGKVLLAEGESCSISVPGINNGAIQYPTCSGGRISTGMMNGKTLTLNGTTIACK